MKALYINIVLAVIAIAAVAFGAYEYGLTHGAVPRRQAAPAAQGPSLVTKATDGSWTVRCRSDAPDKCVAAVNVANKDKQLVMIWMVGATQSGGLGLTVQTPTGVALEPGMDFTLDANPAHHLPFGACGPAACRANLVLDGAAQDELRKASKADASFTMTTGRKVTYSVPLTGSEKMLADVSPAGSPPPVAPKPSAPPAAAPKAR